MVQSSDTIPALVTRLITEKRLINLIVLSCTGSPPIWQEHFYRHLRKHVNTIVLDYHRWLIFLSLHILTHDLEHSLPICNRRITRVSRVKIVEILITIGLLWDLDHVRYIKPTRF